MKKTELIKKISEEFNLDEIKVSEYFDNIFETLTVAITKNKNVNIGEFGRFKVKEKKSEDGLKEKTVLFSPVKKFANDVNYNFNDLSPVQIRVINERSLKYEVIAEEFPEDEIEDIILIDFEDEDKKEEILIPEEPPKEIPQIEPEPKAEPEKEEDILIPEFTKCEIPEEKPPLEIQEDTKKEIPPVEICIEEEVKNNFSRIIEEFKGVELPQNISFDFDEILKLSELTSKSENVISEVTTIIKQESPLPEIPEMVTEEKVEEKLEPEIPKVLEEEIKEKQETEELVKETDDIEELKEEIEKQEKRAQNIFESVEDIISEEMPGSDSTIKETPEEETPETPEEETPETPEEEKSETPKTNLELEAELLKMLDERKKIIEEIKKLENLDLEDLLELNEPGQKNAEEKPILFDEDSLDKQKQDVFIDENGKILENLLKDFKSEDELKKKPEDDIPETSQHPENIGSSYVSEGIEKYEEVEETGNIPEENIDDLENLFGSIYGEEHKEIFKEPKDAEPHLNNLEMNVFDKLLDKSEIKEDKIPEDLESKDIEKVNEPENVFVTFKTEKTGEAEQEIDEELQEKMEKTEAIKTYDDIFNLIEPNGKKNGKKHKEVKKTETEKKVSSPLLKLIITIVILIVLIFVSVYIYQRSIYKPPEETPQVQVADSVKSSGNDSIVYADTNKTAEKFGGNVVYNEEGYEIKETGKGFYLHFGNFDNQFELAKKIKELKEKNINLDYEKIMVEEKEVYKIVAGPYNTIEEAKQIILKL